MTFRILITTGEMYCRSDHGAEQRRVVAGFQEVAYSMAGSLCGRRSIQRPRSN